MLVGAAPMKFNGRPSLAARSDIRRPNSNFTIAGGTPNVPARSSAGFHRTGRRWFRADHVEHARNVVGVCG